MAATPAVVRDVGVPAIAIDERRPAPVVPTDDSDDPEHEHHSKTADTVVAEMPKRSLDTFSMLGVTWESGLELADTRVQARWRADGAWTDWADLDIEPSEQGTPGTEPVWVDQADAAAVRVLSSSGATPRQVALTTIDPGKTPTITTAASFAAAASSGVQQPSIISRSAWGASNAGSCDSPIYGDSTQGVVIHHTAGSNTYTKVQSASIVKATQAYHTKSRKWCDIGYNFLVDKYGQIFEGRKGGIDKSVRAAHAGNGAVNEETAGISLMGTFTSTAPTSAMKTAVANLTAWKLSINGDPAKGTYRLGGLTLNRIAGHRNVVGTECPGAQVYSWLSASGGLRDRAEDLIAAGGTAEKLDTPTGLKTTASTLSSVSFDWNDVTDAEKYHLKVSTSPSMSSPIYAKVFESKATVTGLKPGTTYYAAAAVVDPNRTALLSDYTGTPFPTATTPTSTTPSGLKITASTQSSLSFAWNAIPGAEKYHVKVSTSRSMSSAVYGRFTENKGTVVGLKPGTTYYYSVALVDPALNALLSEYSPVSSGSTPKTAADGTVLPAPSGLKVAASSPTSMTFVWNPVSGARKYHVKVSKSSSMSGPTFGKFTTTSGTVTGLTPGTKYYFAVVVVNPDDNTRASEYSPTASASTPTENPGGMDFPPPTGLVVSSSTPTSLSFAWSAVPGAKKYHVKVSKSSSMSGPTFGKFTTNQGTVTGLTAGTKYYFSIVVVDPSDNTRASEYTAPSTATTPRETAGGASLPVPSDLRVASSTPTSLSFAWSAVPGAKKYHVKVSKSSSMSGPTFGKFTTNQGTVTGLAAGTKYYFSIVVVDPSNNTRASEYSTPASFTTPAAGGLPFSAPTNLRSTAATSTSLSFAWSAVPGAKKYHVKVSKSSSMSGPTFGKFTTNQGTVTGLAAGTKYYFSIVVVDPSNNTRASEYSGTPYPSASTVGASSASNTVTVPSSGTVAFDGHGYGHGIGMSQYGAEGAARDGESYTSILSHYYPGTAVTAKSGDIRVLISADTTDGVLVKASAGLKIQDLAGKRTISLPTSIGGKTVDRWEIVRTDSSASRSKLRYRTTGAYTNYLDDGSALTWSGDGQFTGPSTIGLILPDGATMQVRGDVRSAKPSSGSSARNTVNVLPLDEYVKGVIPAEMPASWHAEALKAQAVAARTYGFRSMGGAGYYDICSTTSCQVYGGATREVASTNSAVSATAGKILTYQGKPALTQFSSSSGGYTHAGSQPYLKAVDDPWDGWSGNKNHDWTISVKASTIEKAYSSIGTLKSMQVTQRTGRGDMGGRVSSLKLVGSKSTKTITGVDARWAFGLRSDWFGF